MAFTLLDKVAAKNTNSNSATTASKDTTGATLIVIGIVYFPGGGTPTVSDSKGNTWTQRRQAQPSISNPQPAIAIYESKPTSVGSGHTFTVSLTGSNPSIHAAWFSSSGTPQFDQSNGAGSSTQVFTQSTGSVTPTKNGELVIALAAGGGGSSSMSGVDSGQTFLTTNTGDGINYCSGMSDEIQTTATARNPTFTQSLPLATAMAAVICTWSMAAAQFAGNATATVSTTSSVNALNRFQADATVGVRTTPTLVALSHFLSDVSIAVSALANFLAGGARVTTWLINNVDVSRYVVHKKASLQLGSNGTPDTASCTIKGGTDGLASVDVGQAVVIVQGVTTLFAGEIIEATFDQPTAADTPSWQIAATDYLFLLKRKLITQTWVETDADVIAAAIMATAAADGFTAVQVESGLPAVTLACAFEDPISALNRLASLVNAQWRLNAKDLYFRTTSTLTSPSTLNSSNRTFQRLKYTRRITDAITRLIVEGGGTEGGQATVVATGAPGASTTLPLTQALGFSPSGVAIVRFSSPDIFPSIEETYLVSYSGVQLAGSVAAPLLAPAFNTLSSSPAGSVAQGQYYYGQNYITSAGETGVGPVLAVFTSSFPPDFPATGSVTLVLQPPSEVTATEIGVYRSFVNGSSTFLFRVGSVTRPTSGIWPNPCLFVDTSGDDQLSSSPSKASGASCPQGTSPPLFNLSQFPALTGIANALGGTLPAIPSGASVTLAARVTDATKATALAALEGTSDGVREVIVQRPNTAVSADLALAIATSMLSETPIPIEELTFNSEDQACLPLANVTVSLPGASATLQIQTVGMTWPTPTFTQRSVKAASYYKTLFSWLTNLNRLLKSSTSGIAQ